MEHRHKVHFWVDVKTERLFKVKIVMKIEKVKTWRWLKGDQFLKVFKYLVVIAISVWVVATQDKSLLWFWWKPIRNCPIIPKIVCVLWVPEHFLCLRDIWVFNYFHIIYILWIPSLKTLVCLEGPKNISSFIPHS